MGYGEIAFIEGVLSVVIKGKINKITCKEREMILKKLSILSSISGQTRRRAFAFEPARNVRIKVATLLTRLPSIVPPAPPLETLYQEYQRESQSYIPLLTEFYFKKGSVAERRWLSKQGESGVVLDAEEEEARRLEEEVQKADVVTRADLEQDRRSLQRLLYRRLYLVLQNRDGGHWEFPGGSLEKPQLLHEVLLGRIGPK